MLQKFLGYLSFRLATFKRYIVWSKDHRFLRQIQVLPEKKAFHH